MVAAEQSDAPDISCAQCPRKAVEVLILAGEKVDTLIADVDVVLRTATGVIEGKTLPSGYFRFDDVPEGPLLLTLPNNDSDSWARIDSSAIPPGAPGVVPEPGQRVFPNAPVVAHKTPYVAVAGDCIVSIAASFGLMPGTLWAANELIQATCGDKATVPVGTSLTIPAVRLSTIDVEPGNRYRLRLDNVITQLSVRFLDEKGNARGDKPCRVAIKAASANPADQAVNTTADGWLKLEVPACITSATVTMTDGKVSRIYEFSMGYVRPLPTLAGKADRLRSLGFYPGAPKNATEATVATARERHIVAYPGIEPEVVYEGRK